MPALCVHNAKLARVCVCTRCLRPALLLHFRRPDASQVAADLLAFADTLVKQRAAGILQAQVDVAAQQPSSLPPQPTAMLSRQRAASLPLPSTPSAQWLFNLPQLRDTPPAAGQQSGSSQHGSIAAVAGSNSSMQSASVGDQP